jgi:REP element-mobilizing transposase RayT
VQPSSETLGSWLSTAQQRLKYDVVTLDEKAREIVIAAITSQTRLHNYAIQALSVMREHVHLIMAKHPHPCEKVINAFKSVSARHLRKYFGLAASPATRNDRATGGAAKQTRAKRVPIWSRGYWVRYLTTNSAVSAAIAYVNEHSKKQS